MTFLTDKFVIARTYRDFIVRDNKVIQAVALIGDALQEILCKPKRGCFDMIKEQIMTTKEGFTYYINAHNNFRYYSGEGGDIVIPSTFDGEPFTKIDSFMFNYCSNIRSVIIPNSVTEIGVGAFGECTGLKKVTLPESVMTIKGYAFDGCTSLKDIVFPKGVTLIGEEAFARCTELMSVEISSAKIEEQAFLKCSGLNSVVIHNSLVGAYAFSECNNLTDVVLDGITKIDRGTFSHCESLKHIDIPNTVTEIEDNAFRGCISLESIVVPDSVKRIGNNAFEGCVGLKSVVMSPSTKLGSKAFFGCTRLLWVR